MIIFVLWFWRRISDWYTGLDVYEWWTFHAGAVGSLGVGAWAVLEGAPVYDIFLAAIVVPLVFLGILIAWQSTRESPFFTGKTEVNAPRPSPLKIEFNDEWSCSDFIKEPPQIGHDMISRRVVWVNIQNSSDHDVRNVRAEIGSFVAPNSDTPEDIKCVFASKTVALRFQDDETVLDFSPHMSARLYMISYAQQLLSGFIRIEGIDRDAHGNQFMHSSDLWKFKVKVTAQGFLSVQREFTASVNEGGLEVQACDGE